MGKGQRIEKIIMSTTVAMIYLLILSFTFVIGTEYGPNYAYVNVTTTVNITNAFPVIESVTIDPNILLNAGGTKTVFCNLSVLDYNGHNDINLTNATFWENQTWTQAGANNNNSRYFNSSCTKVNGDGFYANYTCAFEVWYYANATTEWICNASIVDQVNFSGNNYNSTTIQPYFALNVTPSITYGEMILSNTSANHTANISNFGNQPINISVYGYGGFDPVIGNNYAMICEKGNITLENHKFSANIADNFAAKVTLGNTTNMKNISGFTLPKRIDEPINGTTYWQLYTDPTNAPFGFCNGTVVFTAVSSS